MQMFKLRLLVIFAVLHIQLVFGVAVKGTGSCPIRQTVKTCLPKCLSDFECIGYKRCCPNICGSMSCADVSPVATGNEPYNQDSRVICGNVKCLPGQKCISDSPMKRPRCA